MGIVFYFGCSLRTNGYCDLSFDAFSCSWRTDVNIVDYLLILSSHLYRTEVILYDSLICDFMSLG